MTTQSSEIAVVGSGMVGAAIALGLAKNGFQVIVIENQKPFILNSNQPDVRIFSINISSATLLKDLDIWDEKIIRMHPYHKLEVWEYKNAHVIFDAHEFGLSKLGFMVEDNTLRYALWNALNTHSNITLLCPSKLKNIYRKCNRWILNFYDGQKIEVLMIIGADGSNSQIRQWAGIETYVWQYRQSCMLITVKCEEKQPKNITWQYFSPTGPRAFLPLYDNWASLVWYDDLGRISQLKDMTMSQLKQEIMNLFPSRIGSVTPVACKTFSLIRLHALQYVKNGLALIGDAAHTIHPLLGQGVNLGYRDVSKLLEIIISARNHMKDWTDLSILKRYQSYRQVDNFFMQSGVDLLYIAFKNNLVPLRIIRNLGFTVIQHNSILKRLVLQYALGL